MVESENYKLYGNIFFPLLAGAQEGQAK